MKNIFKLATLFSMFAMIAFVGCEDPMPEGPMLSVSVNQTSATYVTLNVQTQDMSRIACLAKRTDNLTEAPVAPNKMVVFATGTTHNVKNGKQSIRVENLQPGATYSIYVAAEIASTQELHADLVELAGVSTADLSEDILIVPDYRGYTVNIKVPERVKEEGNKIKWTTADLFLYNKNSGNHSRSDSYHMQLNDDAWGNFFFDETCSFVVTEDNSYKLNPDGTPDKDLYLYETIVPGQPQVFIAGEYTFGASDIGWGYGYYEPLFNEGSWMSACAANGGMPVDETPYWTGVYHHEEFVVKEPTAIDESLVTLEATNIGTNNAEITITADKSISALAIMVLGDLERDNALNLLNNNEDYLQWFATSLVGVYEGVCMTIDPYDKEAGYNGVIKTNLSDWFFVVDMDSRYYVYAVGLRGDYNNDGFMDGNEQVCKKIEFDLKDISKPAPELVVTAIDDVAEVAKFNIKCPTGDADYGYWTANYEKTWLMSNMSAKELIDAYARKQPAYTFSTIELGRINSAEGLTVTFPSRPNERFHFAALIGNDEGTETCSDAVVCYVKEAEVAQIESPYFESLLGDWTASATITYKKLINDETNEYETVTTTTSSTITLGDQTYPDVLPEDVYEIFASHGVSREDTDLYYGEFKEAVDLFNDNNRAHNRILANGFNFADEMLPHLPYFKYRSAYELFTADDYNGLSNSMPVYDFGPKWYIEVMEDGSLAVPFNTEFFYPMSSHAVEMNTIKEAYMIGYDPSMGAIGYFMSEDGKAVNGYFPIEVSEDGNTITIKPLLFNYGSTTYTFYPNVGTPTSNQGEFGINISIISEITLTRGAQPTTLSNKGIKDVPVMQQVNSLNEIRTSKRIKQHTPMGNKQKAAELKIDRSLTPEQRGQLWIETRRNAGK